MPEFLTRTGNNPNNLRIAGPLEKIQDGSRSPDREVWVLTTSVQCVECFKWYKDQVYPLVTTVDTHEC